MNPQTNSAFEARLSALEVASQELYRRFNDHLHSGVTTGAGNTGTVSTAFNVPQGTGGDAETRMATLETAWPELIRLFNAHTHSGVQTGASNTGIPGSSFLLTFPVAGMASGHFLDRLARLEQFVQELVRQINLHTHTTVTASSGTTGATTTATQVNV